MRDIIEGSEFVILVQYSPIHCLLLSIVLLLVCNSTTSFKLEQYDLYFFQSLIVLKYRKAFIPNLKEL